MKEECNHTYKITAGDVFLNKVIIDRELVCLNCGKKIKIKTKRLFISIFFGVIMTFIFIFISDYLKEQLSNIKTIVVYLYQILVLLGYIRILIFVLNLIVVIISKRLKYIEVKIYDE